MADDAAGVPATAEDVDRLQNQVDDLVATLEAHQRLFEQLRGTGALPAEPAGG